MVCRLINNLKAGRSVVTLSPLDLRPLIRAPIKELRLAVSPLLAMLATSIAASCRRISERQILGN
jgi:hypothetical protein